MDAPLRGADPVNDEFEIGYDQPFEKRWHKVEIGARVVMVLYVAAAASGLLGDGPLSHHTLYDKARDFAVDYEPIARSGTGTQVTIHLLRPPPIATEMSVTLSNEFGEPFGLSTVEPRPERSILGADGVTMIFDIAPGQKDDLIRVKGSPTQAGLMHLSAQLGAGPTLSWTQVVLP